jgi:benzoylsuccinyl-CoA thiolase BbsA subunit
MAMANSKEEKKPAKKKKEKEPDVTFYLPELLEAPENSYPPYLKGYKCKKCGQLDFPKVAPCPNCWGDEFEMIPLSRRGKLYSSAEILVGQPGMEVPYTIGYVDLPENIRIFAQMEGDSGDLHCGDEMELTVGTIRLNRDGLPITSYKFKRVSP